MSDEPRTAELNILETALKGLKPSAALDRSELLFRAGQESMRSKVYCWKGLAACAALMLAFNIILMTRQRPEPIVSLPVRQETAASFISSVPLEIEGRRPHPTSYLTIRQLILDKGVEALPPPPPPPVPPLVSRQQLLDL